MAADNVYLSENTKGSAMAVDSVAFESYWARLPRVDMKHRGTLSQVLASRPVPNTVIPEDYWESLWVQYADRLEAYVLELKAQLDA